MNTYIYIYIPMWKFIIVFFSKECLLQCCRVAKTHRISHLCWSFFAKKPYHWWIISGKRPEREAILWVWQALVTNSYPTYR